MGSECESTRSRVPTYSRQVHVGTVEFGLTSTVAHRQAGTRWDVEQSRSSSALAESLEDSDYTSAQRRFESLQSLEKQSGRFLAPITIDELRDVKTNTNRLGESTRGCEIAKRVTILCSQFSWQDPRRVLPIFSWDWFATMDAVR